MSGKKVAAGIGLLVLAAVVVNGGNKDDVVGSSSGSTSGSASVAAKWSEFIDHESEAANRAGPIMGGLAEASSDIDLDTAQRYAGELGAWGRGEQRWLAAHPAAQCYRQLWSIEVRIADNAVEVGDLMERGIEDFDADLVGQAAETLNQTNTFIESATGMIDSSKDACLG